jgi:hypothetical protein
MCKYANVQMCKLADAGLKSLRRCEECFSSICLISLNCGSDQMPQRQERMCKCADVLM